MLGLVEQRFIYSSSNASSVFRIAWNVVEAYTTRFGGTSNRESNRSIGQNMIQGFRSRLAAGERLLGTMVTLPDPAVSEILASIGFDWLFIDCEHGPLGLSEVLGILRAVGDKIACIVRVPDASEAGIKKVLDVGATGIIVPLVNSADEATKIVHYAKYAPLGGRGVGLARAHGYGANFSDYLAKANDETVVIVQAEHRVAVENIESIVKVPGVDAILLGPYDLSASLGKMGLIDDPLVTSAIERVFQVCQKNAMPLGYFGISSAAVMPYIQQGYTLIVAGVDTLLLRGAGARILKELTTGEHET
jgi:2-dehydro-3-deoxyglucarate aldolase